MYVLLPRGPELMDGTSLTYDLATEFCVPADTTTASFAFQNSLWPLTNLAQMTIVACERSCPLFAPTLRVALLPAAHSWTAVAVQTSAQFSTLACCCSTGPRRHTPSS